MSDAEHLHGSTTAIQPAVTNGAWRDPSASRLVAACEAAWRSIRSHHAETPDVVIVLGTGVERGRLVKLGHWWEGRWTADGEVRGEVLLAGEALHLPPTQVFEVLLHEAAHGLNAARQIKDASRGGRYHNVRFKAAAEEIGLSVSQMAPYGWARTALCPEATVRYEAEITAIGEAMRIARRIAPSLVAQGRDEGRGPETEGEAGTSGPRPERGATPPPAVCGCGRRMRMAPSVLAQGPVTCGLCGKDFATTRDVNATADICAIEQSAQPVDGDGVRALVALAATADGARLLAQVGAWRHAQRYGAAPAIEVHDSDHLADANRAARAILKLDGDLTGESMLVAGKEMMIGELVVVGSYRNSLVDVDGVELPPTGVFGIVVESDPRDGTVTVDFAIAGTNRIDVESPAAAALEYGYAEVVPAPGAPLVDLRTIPDAEPPERNERNFVPELTW